MRKLLLAVLVLLTLLCGCTKKEEKPKDEKIAKIEGHEYKEDGSYVTAFTLQNRQIFVYQPADVMHGDIINYGYSAPMLLVFGDKKMDRDEAVAFIREKGVDKVAQKNGGSVIFVNPLSSWEKEDEGIYEAIMAQTMVGQTGFSHGILYDGAKRQYYIFASPALTVLCGYGSGADYIGRYYIKEVHGTSSMSALGGDDITPTAVVLENLGKKPEINDRNIIIISRSNTTSYDKHMESGSDHFHISSDSFEDLYREYINGYQRWNGKLSETFNPDKLGLVMDTYVFDVTTSKDNKQASAEFHRTGTVVWYLKETKKKKRPLVLCFHGGGDTAITTASIAGWPAIAAEEDFILCAIEMHMRTTATETMQIIEKLKELYSVDETRIYATGFSMGGIKTWDLYQEYPQVFAALAPMGATVGVGQNTQFGTSPAVNDSVMVPVIYCGGENSHLQELPFQGQTVIERINYLFDINSINRPFDMTLGNKSEWEDSKYGYKGNSVEELKDPNNPGSVTTIRYYKSQDGNVYTALCSISGHAHEIRPFTCRKAWEFMKQFRRMADGRIVITQH